MARSQVRKRCNECKRVLTGDRDRKQWCDRPGCAGELLTIRYAKTHVRSRRH